MLYVTTRSNRDAYTANRAVLESRGPDGGLYVPFRLPVFSQDEIAGLPDYGFAHNVAHVLNVFFNTKLTEWDVAFCIGRNPVRIKRLSSRIAVGECWHNPQWDFSFLVKTISEQICIKAPGVQAEGDWPGIAIRIAILFGVFGELLRSGVLEVGSELDASVSSDDFSAPISLWYARTMGLPVGSIICCCNENNTLWDLFHNGQFRTDAVAVTTDLPFADVTLPVSLERLIHACGGPLEVVKYLDACRLGRGYYPSESLIHVMRRGIHVSVVSQSRTNSTISTVLNSTGYVLSPYAALAYAGLQDYASHHGSGRFSLVMSERSPRKDIRSICRALNAPEEEIKRLLDVS